MGGKHLRIITNIHWQHKTVKILTLVNTLSYADDVFMSADNEMWLQ